MAAPPGVVVLRPSNIAGDPGRSPHALFELAGTQAAPAE
jgi:hypothetical protein